MQMKLEHSYFDTFDECIAWCKKQKEIYNWLKTELTIYERNRPFAGSCHFSATLAGDKDEIDKHRKKIKNGI